MNRVRKTAEMLADAIKQASPDLGIGIQHHENTAGKSSYVHVSGHRFYRGARVSDHPIGMKRFKESAISLYLRPYAKPSDWSVWIGEIVTDWQKQNQH